MEYKKAREKAIYLVGLPTLKRIARAYGGMQKAVWLVLAEYNNTDYANHLTRYIG